MINSKIIKSIIIKYLKVINISNHLFVFSYFLFFSLLVADIRATGEMENLSFGLIFLFFLAFIFYIVALLSISFYKYLCRKLKIRLLFAFITTFIYFYIIPMILKAQFRYSTVVGWVFLAIIIITSIMNYITFNLIIDYFNDYDERELYTLLYGQTHENIDLSKNEITSRIKYISRQKIYCFLLLFLLMNPFVYRDQIILLLFFILIVLLIFVMSFLNYKQVPEAMPSKKLLVFIVFIFILIYIIHSISFSITYIRSEDVRFLTISVVISLILHFYNIGKKYSVLLLNIKHEVK